MKFEEFLTDKHAEDYHGLDDEMPDAFEAWLVELDIDTIIDYANEFADLKVKNTVNQLRA